MNLLPPQSSKHTKVAKYSYRHESFKPFDKLQLFHLWSKIIPTEVLPFFWFFKRFSIWTAAIYHSYSSVSSRGSLNCSGLSSYQNVKQGSIYITLKSGHMASNVTFLWLVDNLIDNVWADAMFDTLVCFSLCQRQSLALARKLQRSLKSALFRMHYCFNAVHNILGLGFSQTNIILEAEQRWSEVWSKSTKKPGERKRQVIRSQGPSNDTRNLLLGLAFVTMQTGFSRQSRE